ncbi:MAG: metallophosphoesterase family protein [Coriobacteriia bacterium]|nr:metallophosphoesterase family protein [Coriobacteriia bacterium]
MNPIIRHVSRRIPPLTARAVRAWHRVSAPAAFALALVVGLVAFGAFARAEFPVGPARVSVATAPALEGRTTLTAPPFGSVSAPTHPAPVRLEATLTEVDVPRLQRLAENGVPDEVAQTELTDSLRRGAWKAVGTGLLAAAVASAFVGWSLRHRLWVLAASTALGVAVPAVLVGWTALAFDATAFQRPTYTGALSYAPSLVQLVQERVSTVEGAREKVSQFTRELATYYARPQSFASGGAMEGTFRVLHVSDTHLDPVGEQLTRDLASRFEVDLVIHTGDAVNYGSAVEASLAAASLPATVPIAYVPGNHDSPAVLAELRGLPNVTVLDRSSASFEGLTVYGVGDPLGASTGFEPDTGTARRLGEEGAEDVRERIAAGEATPSVVAVHDPESAPPFTGLAEAVLFGHTHSPQLTRDDGTWMLGPGTTGGVHFSELRPDPHIPHGAAILYYTAEMPRRLVAIDQIEVDGRSERFTLSRTVADASLLPPEAAAGGAAGD